MVIMGYKVIREIALETVAQSHPYHCTKLEKSEMVYSFQYAKVPKLFFAPYTA